MIRAPHPKTALVVAYVYLAQLGCAPGSAPNGSAADDPKSTVSVSSRRDRLAPTRTGLHPVSLLEAARPSPGVFQVTPTGAATWTMPIWTPPGRNDIRPQLSVAYDSKAAAGFVGLGFSIQGFSSINRCWKTLAQDGAYSSGPHPDEFCLDGHRLVQIDATQTTPPIGFSLEFDPGTRVRITEGTRTNPLAFEVLEKGGRIRRYGSRDATSAGRVQGLPIEVVATVPPTSPMADDSITTQGATPRTVSWNIDRLEDRWGNHIDYNYVRQPGLTGTGVEVLPSEILWTGHGATLPTRRASFVFGEARKDARTGYQSSVAVEASRRLTAIQLQAQDRLTSDPEQLQSSWVPLREYRFSYVPVLPGQRMIDRLSTITECAANLPGASWSCVSPIEFAWKGLDSPLIPKFDKHTPDSTLYWEHMPGGFPFANATLAADVPELVVGDFNGDGFDDAVFRRPTTLSSKDIDTQLVNGTPLPIGQWRLAMGSTSGLVTSSAAALPASVGGNPWLSPRVVDLQGDGRSELVLNVDSINGNPMPGVDAMQAYVFYEHAQTLSSLPNLGETYSYPSVIGNPEYSFSFNLADFDGDGRVDVIRDDSLVANPFHISTLVLRRGGPSQSFLPNANVLLSSNSAGPVVGVGRQERHVVDVDGNGQPELVARQLTPGVVGSLPDGLPATLASLAFPTGAPNGAVVRQTRLSGLSLEWSATAERLIGLGCSGGPGNIPTFLQRFFADINGDGLPDSVALPPVVLDNCGTRRNFDGKFFTALNVGGEFLPAQLVSASSPLFRIPQSLNYARDRSLDNGVRFADIDGDGRQDILLVGPTDWGGSSRSNMVVYRSTSTGFEQLDLGIPINRSGFVLGSGIIAGYGPRTTRLGDFNGDGLIDITTVETGIAPASGLDAAQVVIWQQRPREPDVVSSISGGAHTPRVDISYGYAGPANPSLYTAGTQCVYPQKCVRHFGWVVQSHAVEASNFEGQVLSTRFEHAYEDARIDLRGRGLLGVRAYTRKDVTTLPSTTETMVFDLDSRASTTPDSWLGRYAYSNRSAPVRVTTTTPNLAGHYVVDLASDAQMTLSGGVFRTTSVQQVRTERDNGAVVTSTRSTLVFDQYGTTVVSRDETSTGVFQFGTGLPSPSADVHGTEVVAVGANDSDEARWLVVRYPGFSTTSSEPGASPASVTRTLSVLYEPNSIDAQSVTIEPSAAPEVNYPSVAPTSGFTRTLSLTRDAWGNARALTETGSGQTRTSTTRFDSAENMFPVETRNAEGHVSRSYFHAGLGLLVAADDETGTRTELEFDALLRPKVMRTGIRANDGLMAGHQESWSYLSGTSSNAPERTYFVKKSSQVAGTRTAKFDPFDRLLELSSDGLNGPVREGHVYDRFGRLTSSSLPGIPGAFPVYIERSYDRLGRLLSVTRPGETRTAPTRSSTYSYEARTTTYVSERGVEQRTETDAKGREIAQTTRDPAMGRDVVTQYAYAPFDQLRSVIHPSLNVPMSPAPLPLTTSMTYDVLGRRQRLNDPDTGQSDALYNAFGELKWQRDATGAITRRGYDLIGRPLTVVTEESTSYPSRIGNGLSQNTTYVWDMDVDGQISSILSNDDVLQSFTYDAFARPSGFSWRVQGQSIPFSLGYDSLGRIGTLTYPESSPGSPFRVRYGFAANGEVQTLYDASNAGAERVIWRQVARNASGASTEEQFGTTASTVRTYDAGNKLRFVRTTLSQSGTSVQRLSYRWTDDGLLKSRTDAGLGLVELFDHDFMSRVSGWTVHQNCESSRWRYDYDDWGNLRGRTKLSGNIGDSVVNDYTLGADASRPHALKRSTEGNASNTYSYDAAGNRTSGNGTGLTWAPFGLPWKMENGASTSTFEYDGTAARVLQRVSDAAGVWQSDVTTVGGLYERRNALFQAEHTYNVFSPNGLVAQIRRAGTQSGSAESTHFVHRDVLGSPDTITNELGQVIDQAKYDPFGERRHPWAVAHPLKQRHASNASYGYTGHEPDDAFGFVNMKGRIYDAKMGRFLTPDPVAHPFSEGLNRYSYVWNSPLQFTDPTGFDGEADAELHKKEEIPDYLAIWASKFANLFKPAASSSSSSGGIPTSDSSSGTRFGDSTSTDGLTDDNIAEIRNITWGATRSTLDEVKPIAEEVAILNPLVGIGVAVSGQQATGGDASTGHRIAGTFPAGTRAVGLLGAAWRTVRNVVSSVRGSFAAKAGEHIVLGLRNYGLENTAAQVGGRTLLSDPNWKRSLLNAIADPKAKFSVSVDGLAGSSTAEKIMRAVQQGIKPGGSPTNWEMSQLYQAGRLKDVTFLERGAPVPNPFQ